MTKRVLFFTILSLSLFAGFKTFGQADNPIEKLVNQALIVKIEAKILDENNKIAWSTEVNYPYLPGRQAKVILSGNNILINAFLTAYKDEGEKLLLFAQGEMWITDMNSGKKSFYSDSKKVLVNLGEKVYYFPLGYEGLKKNRTTIELDIQIDKYKDYLTLESKLDKEKNIAPELSD